MAVFVTGATGFIGGQLVRMLYNRGERDIRVLVRPQSKRKAEKLTAKFGNAVKVIIADPSNHNQYEEHLRGAETVYHAAAKASVWGWQEDFERDIFALTSELARSARNMGVANFIYYSSQSATFTYRFGREQLPRDHNTPYPPEEDYIDHYSSAKAYTEKDLLKTFNNNEFHVTILRPGWVWGPGDTNLFDTIVATSQSRMPFILPGNRKAPAAPTYVDNLNAAAIEMAWNSAAWGKAFYIVDAEQKTVGEFLDDLLVAAGLPIPSWGLPYSAAYVSAKVLERIYKILFKMDTKPPLTRYEVTTLAKGMDIYDSKAIKILGAPPINYEEGIERFSRWWAEEGRAGYEERHNVIL